MNCTCHQPGFCPTFKKNMTNRQYLICRGLVLSPQKCDAYRRLWLYGKAVKDSPTKPTPGLPGIGDKLQEIIYALGFEKDDSCGCGNMVIAMNAWGIEGCEKNRDIITSHLDDAYTILTTSQRLMAYKQALLKGYALRLKIRDLSNSLLDEAIRLWELDTAKMAVGK